MARFWYAYIIPTADPRLSSSYQRLNTNNASPRCSTGTVLCAVNATGGGSYPISPLSANLQSYIAAALVNNAPQPESPIGSKFYVYLKPS